MVYRKKKTFRLIVTEEFSFYLFSDRFLFWPKSTLWVKTCHPKLQYSLWQFVVVFDTDIWLFLKLWNNFRHYFVFNGQNFTLFFWFNDAKLLAQKYLHYAQINSISRHYLSILGWKLKFLKVSPYLKAHEKLVIILVVFT